MTQRLAIIPARGGSKRIPGKNIRDFCGKPMLGHILSAARDSSLFDCIHVSSDSEQVLAVAGQLGFPADFPRPAHYADDHTGVLPVLRWVVEEYQRRGQVFDEVWLLMACAPLIEPADLIDMAQHFAAIDGQKYALITVAPFPAPFQRGYYQTENGALRPIQPEHFKTRSQDLPQAFYDAGAVGVFSSHYLLAMENGGNNRHFHGYMLPRWKAVDIDTHDDWELAEIIWRATRGRNM